MTQPAEKHPDALPIGWIRWRPVGQLSRDQDGDLVFPPVAAEPGIYRFMIQDGNLSEVLTGHYRRPIPKRSTSHPGS